MALNPIGWAQFFVAASPRRHVQVAAGYPIVLLALLLAGHRIAQPVSASDTAKAAIGFLLVSQLVLLGFVGMGAVRRAVLRDFTTNIIESHRLTPMSGGTAMLGYLTGPPSQLLMLAAENLILGAALCPAAQQSVSQWVLLHLLLAVTTFFLWSAALVTAVVTRGKANIVALMIVVGVAGGLKVLELVPGLMLLAGVVTSAVSAVTRAAAGAPTLPVLISIPAQLAIGLTFCAAAARRYRRDDVQAFDARLGFVLFLEAAVLFGLGLTIAPQLAPIVPYGGFEWGNSQPLASLILLALLGLVPIAAAAQADAAWLRRKRLDPVFDRPRPIAFRRVWLWVSVGVFVAMAIGARPYYSQTLSARPFLAAICCIVAGLGSLAAFVRLAYGLRPRVVFLCVTFFLVTWIAPIVLDAVASMYGLAAGDEKSLGNTMLLGFSPAGAAWALVTETPAPLTPGLVAQAALALVLLAKRYPSPQTG